MKHFGLDFLEAEDKESLAALAKESTQKNESFGQTFNEAARDRP